MRALHPRQTIAPRGTHPMHIGQVISSSMCSAHLFRHLERYRPTGRKLVSPDHSYLLALASEGVVVPKTARMHLKHHANALRTPTSSLTVSVSLSPLQKLPGHPSSRAHGQAHQEVWATRIKAFADVAGRQCGGPTRIRTWNQGIMSPLL